MVLLGHNTRKHKEQRKEVPMEKTLGGNQRSSKHNTAAESKNAAVVVAQIVWDRILLGVMCYNFPFSQRRAAIKQFNIILTRHGCLVAKVLGC